LIILDVVLVAVLAYAGYQLRSMRQAAKAREAAKLQHKIVPVPPPQFPAQPSPKAVMATGYAEVAQKMLWSKDRNPVVPVEPPPAPPPPKPMPALPVYHGQLNIGDGAGLFAILAVSNTAPHQAIHVGESIGEFKLVGVNREGIDFEWEGKTVHKSLYEVTDHSGAQQAQAEAPHPVAVAAPRPVVQEKPLGPGADTGGREGIRICQPGDTNPAGVVVDGYRKVLRPSPFGNYCYWEPVGR
jgi:hypothetical protein